MNNENASDKNKNDKLKDLPYDEDMLYPKEIDGADCIMGTPEDEDEDEEDELPCTPSEYVTGEYITKLLIDMTEYKHTPTKYRENIISQLMSVLISSNKPNALLCGPAGCGKTQIVEELAQRLKDGTGIAPQLANYRIYAFNLSGIMANTGMQGDLENKINRLIDFLSDEKTKSILFIDEIHILFKTESYSKIAQILKPALSRGGLKLIGATTTQEAKLIDADPAFRRRLTNIIVEEPTKAQTADILVGMNEYFAKHYGISFSLGKAKAERIVDIADEFCYAGSHRPDNAITLLDRSIASAIVKNTGCTADSGAKNKKMKIVLSDSLIKETAFRITSGHGKPQPFNEKALRRDFSRICGQDEICKSLIKVLKLHSLHIRPLKKPLTMLFTGPSGVGKTEIAKIIAKNCSGEKPIILNMSEFHSPSSINRLIGSPTGYIGSDSNAELPFDALRSNPYQVILLDEFEKCDRAVQRLFMSVFDEGLLTANKGAAIDFSKAIIIATANAGCTSKKPLGFTCGSSSASLSSTELSNYFDIELINRFAHRYTFGEISKDTYRKIVEDKLHSELYDIGRLRPELNIAGLFDADELSAAAEQITETTYDHKLGARPAMTSVNSYIDDKLLGSGLPV